MTTPADRTIAALRATHDDLAALVPGLSDQQLTGPSGAAEWTVAQVLSHLGSGAEISLATLRGALDGSGAPPAGFNQDVWDRWNAMPPQDQAAGYLRHDADLVAAFEALTPEQRADLTVDMGFLPAPIPVAAMAGMRLSEAVQHSWDVRVALDPAAGLPAEAAEVIAEHLAGDLAVLTGFIGKADALAGPAVVEIRGSGYGIVIDGGVSLVASPQAPTATFVGPLEAAVRLIGGRLKPGYTADGVTVEGAVSLDDLRRVFPGF
jgi:uncharacterized protein (TIGR03083 family)